MAWRPPASQRILGLGLSLAYPNHEGEIERNMNGISA